MVNKNIYEPSNGLIFITFNNILSGILGILLGILNNNLVVYMSNKFNIKYLFLQNVTQLILCSVLLATLHVNFNYFGWSWQNITPGLFFVSFFFGVQFKMITNIQNTYILEDTLKDTLGTTLDKLIESKKIISIKDQVSK